MPRDFCYATLRMEAGHERTVTGGRFFALARGLVRASVYLPLPSLRRAPVLGAVLALLGTGFSDPEPVFAPRAAPRAYHVAVDGADGNPGTAAQPFRTIGKAVSVVLPGDSVLVHGGTYAEIVRIRRSGTQSRPILLTSAGDGPVTIQPVLEPEPCEASNPTRNRAIQILDGVDDWIVRGLTIVGGVLVSGTDVGDLEGSIFRDRSLPGRGDFDPEAGATLLGSLGVNGSDRVRIVDNVIRGRGVLTAAARQGELVDNDIGFIDCGTGAGIWINRFSDGWLVTGNFVHHTSPSLRHFMEEGIRFGSGSMYNLAEDNRVEDLSGKGRGIATDVNAGWNVIRDNVARRAFMGFNDQTGNWGNQWVGNLAEAHRNAGFSIDAKDDFMLYPDDSVPAFLEMSCNVSVGSPIDLNIGSVRKASFSGNSFRKMDISENARSHWAPAGNLWQGSPQPPPPLVNKPPSCG